MLSRIALALLLCGSAATPVFAQGSSTWFLAEGASNGTFDEDILGFADELDAAGE